MKVHDDNSTLTSLPTGLQRYSGEQDFDLLAVNDTVSRLLGKPSIAETATPTSYGSTYETDLFTGLNNILVPRGEFLSSPLGQSLLNNSGLNPKTQHTPLDFVASEWLNRIQNLSVTNPNYIALYTNTANDFSCSGGANCGTDPQNPAVEQGNTALQVQAVFAFNISSSGDLANLMGGLLQNYSGNLTGSLQDVTNELPTLGLTAPILSALANATLVNDGAYSQPISKTPSTTPSWLSTIASVVWNTVSGVAHAVSIVWNDAVAAASYLYHAAVSLAQHLASTIQAAVNHAISALKAVASAMEAALQALLAFVEREVTTLLSAAFSPIINGINSYVSNVNQAIGTAYGTVSGGSQVSPSEAYAVGAALSGSVFEVGLGIGAVVEVALVILTPVDIGPTFIVSTLMGVLIGSALQLASTSSLLNSVSSQTSFSSSLADSVKQYTDTTPVSSDSNYTSSWVTEVETFIGLLKLAALPFAFGMLADSVINDYSPVLPAIALGLAIAALVITLWLLSHPVFNLTMVLLALILSAGLTAIGLFTARAQVGGLKILAYIDLGVSGLAAGFTVFELLQRYA